VQRIEVGAGERYRWNGEPPAKEEPKGQSPGKILERPMVAKSKKNGVGHANGRAHFLSRRTMSAQPREKEHGGDRDIPALLEKE